MLKHFADDATAYKALCDLIFDHFSLFDETFVTYSRALLQTANRDKFEIKLYQKNIQKKNVVEKDLR